MLQAMAPRPKLSDEFIAWARPKLRSLLEARVEDARPGAVDGRKKGNKSHRFGTLLGHYMDDFGQHPFAQPDFAGNLDSSTGKARWTAEKLQEVRVR